MGNIFAASEIVEIGIQIERNGKDFYETLLKETRNEKAQNIYKYLAGEEEKHIGVFQKILDALNKYEPVESYPGEYYAYMNALASDYVFTQKNKGREIAKKVKSDKEAVQMGIAFEKDSIVFYQGMKQAVPKQDIAVLDTLISQEQNHLKQLLELKTKV